MPWTGWLSVSVLFWMALRLVWNPTPDGRYLFSAFLRAFLVVGTIEVLRWDKPQEEEVTAQMRIRLAVIGVVLGGIVVIGKLFFNLSRESAFEFGWFILFLIFVTVAESLCDTWEKQRRRVKDRQSDLLRVIVQIHKRLECLEERVGVAGEDNSETDDILYRLKQFEA